jgi:hypothetical protein
MTKALPRVRYAALAVLVGVAAIAGFGAPVGASEPESQKVIIEPTPGTYTYTWKGVIPPGATAVKESADDSPCLGRQDIESDIHTLNLELGSARVYKLNTVAFTFSIRWEDADQDSAINVLGPTGGSLGFSDGSTSVETVKLSNLDEGPYKVLACGFSRFLPEDYVGTLEMVVTAKPQPKKPAAAKVDTSGDTSGSAVSPSGSSTSPSSGSSSFNPAPANRVIVRPAPRSSLPAAGTGRVSDVGAPPEASSPAAPPAFLADAPRRTFTPASGTIPTAEFNTSDSAKKIPLAAAMLIVLAGIGGVFFALLLRRRRGLDGQPGTDIVPVAG